MFVWAKEDKYESIYVVTAVVVSLKIFHFPRNLCSNFLKLDSGLLKLESGVLITK